MLSVSVRKQASDIFARHGRLCFYYDVPSLGQVAAVGHALVLAVRPGVAAPAAAAGVGPVRPVPPGVVPVHPHLALAHAAHVQSHRVAPRRRVEQGLVPSQWLLATGAGPFHGGASSHGVEAERLAFQADLRRARFRISV